MIEIVRDLTELPHRREDPETSVQVVETEHVREMQKQVWECLRDLGPSTYEQLIAGYLRSDRPMQAPSGIRTRAKEMRDKGKIRWTGERVLGSTHRRMRVWEAI